jgi:Arc/MetJ family transcription regulator
MKKTTINLDEAKMKEAMEATGLREQTAVIHRGLEELIKKAARERLIKMGGSDPQAAAAPRKRARAR